MRFNNSKGSSTVIILAIVTLIIILVGFFFLWMKMEKLKGGSLVMTSEGEGVSFVYLKEVPYLKTGSEVCFEAGLSCLGMSSVKIVDSSNEFYGYVTPSCDSQLIRESRCVSSFDTEYALDKIRYVKSPNSKSTEILGADYFCTFGDKGKKGIFEFAYCVKREL